MRALRFSTLLAAIGLFWCACKTPSANGAGEPKQKRYYLAQDHYAAYGTNWVHYATVGKGNQTMVFVHGWGGNGNLWREQVHAFANQAQLILIDLPGHGQSSKPATEYTMDYFARAVIAVLRDAGVKRGILVGHSMGTPVICKVYAQTPELVAALVGVDGAFRRPQAKPEQVEQIVGNYRSPDYRAKLKQFVDAMFPNPRTEALRERVLSVMLATPQPVLVSAMEGMFDSQKPAWDLTHVEVPVMAINAKNPIWTPEYETYVRSLSSRSSYYTIEGAGHFLMLEKPVEFNSKLTQMLQQFGLLAK
jgi:pimeloyl-ACP methyl ester carboxylesterase